MNIINKYFNDNKTEPKEDKEILLYFNGISNIGYYNKNEKRFYKEYKPFKFPLYYIYDIDKWIYTEYLDNKSQKQIWFSNKKEPEENIGIIFSVEIGYDKYLYYNGIYIKKDKIFKVDENKKYHISKIKDWIYIN